MRGRRKPLPWNLPQHATPQKPFWSWWREALGKARLGGVHAMLWALNLISLKLSRIWYSLCLTAFTCGAGPATFSPGWARLLTGQVCWQSNGMLNEVCRQGGPRGQHVRLQHVSCSRESPELGEERFTLCFQTYVGKDWLSGWLHRSRAVLSPTTLTAFLSQHALPRSQRTLPRNALC